MIKIYEAKKCQDRPDRLIITFNGELFIEVQNTNGIPPRLWLQTYIEVLDNIREGLYEPDDLEHVLKTLNAEYKGHRYRPEKKGQLTIYDFD